MTPKSDQIAPLDLTLKSIDNDIGKKLKALRKIRKRTQAQLGEYLGVSYQQIQKYERGDSPISASKLTQAAIYLDADLNYFFSNPEDTRDELTSAIESLSNPDLRSSFIELIDAIKKHPKESL